MITNNEIRNDLCCKLPIELVNIIISYIPRPNYINEIKETRIALINEYNDSLIDSDDELDIMEGLDEDYDMYSDEMSFFRLLLWSDNLKFCFFNTDYTLKDTPRNPRIGIDSENFHIYTDYFNIYKEYDCFCYLNLTFQDLSDFEIEKYLEWENLSITEYLYVYGLWCPADSIPATKPYKKPIPKEQIDKYYERLEYKTKIEPWEDYW
jgi:hypothetical protein